jgi:hypothetical protein
MQANLAKPDGQNVSLNLKPRGALVGVVRARSTVYDGSSTQWRLRAQMLEAKQWFKAYERFLIRLTLDRKQNICIRPILDTEALFWRTGFMSVSTSAVIKTGGLPDSEKVIKQ